MCWCQFLRFAKGQMWQRLTITALRINWTAAVIVLKIRVWTRPASATAFRFSATIQDAGPWGLNSYARFSPWRVSRRRSSQLQLQFDRNKYFFKQGDYSVPGLASCIVLVYSISTQKIKVQVKWNCKANRSMFGVQTTGCKEQIWVLFEKTPKIEAEKSLLTRIWC